MVGNAPQTLQTKFQPTPLETNKLQIPVPRIRSFQIKRIVFWLCPLEHIASNIKIHK